jgi:hypothetical protein
MSLGSDTAVVKGCVFANTSGVAIGPRSDVSMLRHVVISDCTFDNIGGTCVVSTSSCSKLSV